MEDEYLLKNSIEDMPSQFRDVGTASDVVRALAILETKLDSIIQDLARYQIEHNKLNERVDTLEEFKSWIKGGAFALTVLFSTITYAAVQYNKDLIGDEIQEMSHIELLCNEFKANAGGVVPYKDRPKICQ